MIHGILVLMLALLVGEQALVHVCPMHAQGEQVESESHATQDAHATHDTHATHDAAATHGTSATHQNSHDNSNGGDHGNHHDACNCLVDCAQAGAVSLATAPVSLVPAPAFVAQATVAYRVAIRVDELHQHHRLPFATAPPLTG